MNDKTPSTPAGGAVAWAVRDHCDGSLWVFVASREQAENLAEHNDDTVAPLYTTPPATVSVEAVLALARELREEGQREKGDNRDRVRDRAYVKLDTANRLELLTRGEK